LVQPIVFPGGPVGSTLERDRLLRKRVEERHLHHLLPRKRTRVNTTSKQSKKNNCNLDSDHPVVAKRYTSSTQNEKNSNIKRKKKKTDNNFCSSSSSSSRSTSSSNSSSSSKSSSSSEVDSDSSLSEIEGGYDMSAGSEYCWLIGKLHLDPDDKKMYITTRVEIDRNGYIVAYRQAVDIKGKRVGKELEHSYHVADIADYTKKSSELQAATTSITSSSSTSSSSSSSPPAAEAISNSLKCDIKGCNVDQYDVCAIGCHKMLCIKHIQLHEQVKSCHAKVIISLFSFENLYSWLLT